MNLLDYIRGSKKGRDANHIEKDALRDAFTYEALEGYETIEGNHFENISKLQKQIRNAGKPSHNNNLFLRAASVAAVVVLGLGGYMAFDSQATKSSENNLLAMNTEKPAAFINIFVPDEFYEEHKTIIRKSNETTKIKYLSEEIIFFRAEEAAPAETTEQGIEELSGIRNKSVIDIYIPNEDYERNETKIAKGNNRAEIITGSSDGTSSIEIYIPVEDYNKHTQKQDVKGGKQ